MAARGHRGRLLGPQNSLSPLSFVPNGLFVCLSLALGVSGTVRRSAASVHDPIFMTLNLVH